MGGSVCPICNCRNQPSLCTTCVNVKILEKQRRLKELRSVRDVLGRHVDSALGHGRNEEKQRIWRNERAERRMRYRELLEQARASLEEEKRRLDDQKERLNEMEGPLKDALEKLSMKKQEPKDWFLPVAELALEAELNKVVVAQRAALQQLSRVFPLRQAGGTGGAEGVRICGVRLPSYPDAGDLHLLPAAELSASLGYLLHFVALAAKYLSAPLLHSAGFAASSSKIWQRASYWSPQAALASAEYPLHSIWTAEAEASSPDPSANTFADSSSANGGRPAGTWGRFPSIGESNKEGSAEGFGDRNGGSSGNSQGQPDFRAVKKAIGLLKRSVACLCACEEARLLSQQRVVLNLKELAPFAAFAQLMAVLTRDSRQTSSVPQNLTRSMGGGTLDEAHGMAAMMFAQGRSLSARSQDVPQYGTGSKGGLRESTASMFLAAVGLGRMDRSRTSVSSTATSFQSEAPARFGKAAAEEEEEEEEEPGWSIVDHPWQQSATVDNIDHWSCAMIYDVQRDLPLAPIFANEPL